jgi:hypothetical protein
MPVGLPYVLPGSRPKKNGQPPSCSGQCAPNVGSRKVGGGAHKIPLVWAGPKTKDEILDKWDPVSRTVVRHYIHRKTVLATYEGGGATLTQDCSVTNLDGNGTDVVYDGGGAGAILCS